VNTPATTFIDPFGIELDLEKRLMHQARNHLVRRASDMRGYYADAGHAIGYQNTFVNQFADFFQAIAEDRQPEPGFEVGLENQKVLDAVSRSIACNGWVGVGSS